MRGTAGTVSLANRAIHGECVPDDVAQDIARIGIRCSKR